MTSISDDFLLGASSNDNLNQENVRARLVKDINLNNSRSNPSNLTNVNGTLYFTADDGNTSRGLWRSDSTSEGTAFVKDILPRGTSGSGFFPSSPNLINLNGTILLHNG